MAIESTQKLLERFLKFPLNRSDEIFKLFSSLQGAKFFSGNMPYEKYLYVPAKKKKSVLLVAHTDTVWNISDEEQSELKFEDGIFSSSSETHGIGADDRAGCALLWAFKDSGNGILLLDGEENKKIGANYLISSNKKLFREICRYSFIIEFDWDGTNSYNFNQVNNSKKFINYINTELGFKSIVKSGGCDLSVLCQKICGINIGSGYHFQHNAKETLVISEWENTYNIVSEFLQKEHPRFKIPLKDRFAAKKLDLKKKLRRYFIRLKLIKI